MYPYSRGLFSKLKWTSNFNVSSTQLCFLILNESFNKCREFQINPILKLSLEVWNTTSPNIKKCMQGKKNIHKITLSKNHCKQRFLIEEPSFIHNILWFCEIAFTVRLKKKNLMNHFNSNLQISRCTMKPMYHNYTQTIKSQKLVDLFMHRFCNKEWRILCGKIV